MLVSAVAVVAEPDKDPVNELAYTFPFTCNVANVGVDVFIPTFPLALTYKAFVPVVIAPSILSTTPVEPETWRRASGFVVFIPISPPDVIRIFSVSPLLP